MTLILSTALLSGCVSTTTDSYCDVASILYFKNSGVVSDLLDADRDLLAAITAHNETYFRLCR